MKAIVKGDRPVIGELEPAVLQGFGPISPRSISFRQNGTCALPGCHHPIAHNHHRHWFSNGGRTALDDMDGRCSKCHTLIHAGRLNVPGYSKDGWPLRQRRRRRIS